MSHFWSLDDDDDDRQAGPSDQGSQLGAGIGSLSPSSRTNSTPRGNATSSSSNPIYALLNGRQEGDSESRIDRFDEIRKNGESKKQSKRSSNEPPIMQLQRAWVSERGCPEILPWRGNAIDDVCSQIEEQMVIVESLASDAATAEEEHVRLGLVELDVERARWLLKSYLRCRLDKIERHAPFLQEDSQSRERMSDLEKGYCVRFAQIQAQHFQASVIDFLPPNLRSLEDKAESGSNGRGDMVTRPDLHSPVFIRCLEDCGRFTFPGHDDVVNFTKGSIHFVRYNTVRQLIDREQVEVL